MGSSQLSSPLAKRQIDESAAVDGLLIFGNTIDQPELTRDLVSGIAQQRKAQFVLVVP